MIPLAASRLHNHRLFLTWFLFIGIYIFAFFIIWDLGILSKLYTIDRSTIAAVITALFLATTVHCGINSFDISSQINQASSIETHLLSQQGQHIIYKNNRLQWHLSPKDNSPPILTSIGNIADYLTDFLHQRLLDAKITTPTPALARTHLYPLEDVAENGWFMADVMIKLGLLGTVVGFIIMLASITNIDQLDIDTVQSLLITMSSGMATALYTTLTGLICGLLVALQYKPLDKGGQQLAKIMSRIALLSVKGNQP